MTRVQEVVGFLEIIAGVWGTVMGITFVSKVSGLLLLLPLTVILLFTFFGIAGLLLYRGHPLGRPLSIVSQVIQVPVFITSWGGYYCVGGAGLRLTIPLDSNGYLGWYVHLGSQLHLSWAAESDATTIGVNAVAVALLVALLLNRHKAATGVTSPASIGGAA